MMDRETFIREQAARLQVAALGVPNYRSKGAEVIARCCVSDATALADALGTKATPEDCYQIPVADADAWMELWGTKPPTAANCAPLYNAILAQRKARQ